MAKWTAAEYAQYEATRDIKQGQATAIFKGRNTVAERMSETPQQHTQALGRLPAGKMNGTEKKYAALLETRKMAGEVIWYAFEPINIRLAKKCYYRCDFLVMVSGGKMECHEVKGSHVTDDGLAKIKMAAEILPFRFLMMQLVKGQWIERIF